MILIKVTLSLLLYNIVIIYAESSIDFGCRDENNNLVDWYYAYKLPEDTTSDHHYNSINKQHNNGLRYMYMTSSQANLDWIESEKFIDDPTSLPGRTVSQLYNTENILSVMYNDESPNGSTDMVNGHTKGVVGTNDHQGFWLIHSVPKFPPNIEDGTYGYPSTGHRYGQSFLCISMTSSMIELVGQQLIYNEPTIYSTKHQPELETSFPNLMRVINGEKIKSSPFWNLVTIKSLAGIEFQSFAKSGRFNKELYEDWVAPTLQTDLLVETWINGPGKIPSNCTQQKRVYNIAEIKLESDTGKMEFSTHHDHSKWAVSKAETDWICVGDINRAEHQKVRGGGTVCQNNNDLAKAYQKIVADIEQCPKLYYHHQQHQQQRRYKYHKLRHGN